MRVRLAVLGLLLVVPGAALAASAQQGECAYTGDWRAQAIPGGTGGPSTSLYAAVGGCALAEVVRDGATWTWRIRADSLTAPGTFSVIGGYATDSGSSFALSPIACTQGVCAVGPLEGAVTSSSMSKLCARIVILREGMPFRSAQACG